MYYGYGRGFGFRESSPPWPYVGRGRGGLPRCWYLGLPGATVPYVAPAPYLTAPTREKELGFLKGQAEATKRQLEDTERRIRELEKRRCKRGVSHENCDYGYRCQPGYRHRPTLRALTIAGEMMFSVPKNRLEGLLKDTNRYEKSGSPFVHESMIMRLDFPHPELYKKIFES